MLCFQCRSDLPESAKFCSQCGAKIEAACPGCGQPAPSGSKFCPECGQDLRKAPAAVRIDTTHPAAYTPKHLADKILTGKSAIEGERKLVTILFADVAGSTAMFENLDPEAVHEIMDGCFRILLDEIHRFEGTVNQFTGDGVMALFGAPIAHEDHAQRACHAALAIQKALTPYRETLKRRFAIDFAMRIGVNTGPVVVGAIGDDLRMDYTAQGDTANLAARMLTLAQPGTIYASNAAFALTEGYFLFENLGLNAVKGKSEPVAVYRLIAPSSRRTRFDVNAEKGLTPLVGRQRDLDALRDVYCRAKAGQGQAVVVSSEAGMGKSRLLYEFRKAIANEDVMFLEGQCLSYSKNVAYHPIMDVLKAFFNIGEGDSDADIGDKVARGLAALGIDPAVSRPYLMALLGCKDAGGDPSAITPEERRQRINEALIDLVVKGARLRPLVLAIEDVHWIDDSSKEAIGEVLETIPTEAVLLVCTCRPEFTPGWGMKTYLHQIVLPRLSESESVAMAAHLLQADRLGNEIARLMADKTEGVPFFIEEVARSLKDLKIIQGQDRRSHTETPSTLRIPSTIQGIIMARVDALPETAKQILRTGSVIEREFGHRLLQRATGFSEKELACGLGAAKDAELIYQRGAGAEATYFFKHALTMEVIYGSLLGPQKRRLHGRAGNAIVALYPQSLDTHSASLARHFREGGMFAEAAKYARAAAKMAVRAGAYTDAIAHARIQVHALEQLPVDETVQRQIIDARTGLATYLLGLNHHLEAKEAVDPIVDLAVALDYRKRLPGIYVAIGSLYCSRPEPEKSFHYLRQAIDLAEETKDWLSYWYGIFFLGCAYSFECLYEKATNCFNQLLDLSEMAKNVRGVAYVKGTMSAFLLSFFGKINNAETLSREAIQAANEIGNEHIKAMAYSSHGQIRFFKGDFEGARRLLTAALNFSQKVDHLAWKSWTEFWLAHIYFFSGQFKDATLSVTSWLSTMKEMGHVLGWQAYGNVFLQRIIITMIGKSTQTFDPTVSRSEKKVKLTEGICEATIADILIKLDKKFIPEAEAAVEKAIAADTRNGTRWFLGQDYAVYADVCKAKGDMAGARANLNKAIDIYRQCGADGWVKRYESQLASMV
jgi:class 3 adenylate cyclase/tetratricopeptide (TPR) repeat protein